MKPSEMLMAAADLIAEGWCQGTTARDTDSLSVGAHHPDARAWCLSGAVVRIMGKHDQACWVYAWGFIEEAFEGSSSDEYNPIHWQDQPGRTKAEVLDLLDEAVRLAKDHGC